MGMLLAFSFWSAAWAPGCSCLGSNLPRPAGRPPSQPCPAHPPSPPPALPAGSTFSVVCLVEPGIFRPVHSFIQTSSAGVGRLEVLALAATAMEEAEMAAAGIESLGLGGGAASAAQQQQQQQQQQQGLQPVPGAAPAAPAAPPAATGAASSSGFVAAPAATPAPRAAAAGGRAAGGSWIVVYSRGPVAGLPEEHESRRERFAELEQLQTGWTVELRTRGEAASTVDAVFYSPAGDCVGAYANARRLALKASKEAAAA